MSSTTGRVGRSILALALLLGLAIAGTAPLRRPSCELVLHVGLEGWQRVRVISEERGELAVFTRGARELRVSPLRYGPYRLRVELDGRPALVATFYQLDVGARKRVEIDLEPAPNGKVRFQEMINGEKPVFTGTAGPDECSEQHPLTLEWI